MKSRRNILLLTLILLVGCALPANSPPQATPLPQPGLYVKADYNAGPVNPLVYGSNTGPWQTLGLEHIELSNTGGISLVRWPGGNWGDENSVTERQLDEYIAIVRKIGAEPFIHVRLFEGTAEEAANLVRLANIDRKYGVKYWAIGNEPDLFVAKRGAKTYGVAEYVRDFKAFRAAMKAVDPSIVIVGPEISQYTGPDSYPVDASGVPWMEGFLKEAGNEVDIVSIHRYPFGDPPATAATLRADPPNWTRMIDQLRSQVQRITGRDLPLAVTEANSDWAGRIDEEAGTDSHRNALWWADVLGRLINGKTTMVAQFCLGAIQAQGIGMFGPVSYDSAPRPLYQVYPLYRQFGNQLVYASSDDTTLPIVASRRADGKLAILVINHAEQARSMPIRIDGMPIGGNAEVWSFAADHPTQLMGTVDIRQPITFEPLSATMLVVP